MPKQPLKTTKHIKSKDTMQIKNYARAIILSITKYMNAHSFENRSSAQCLGRAGSGSGSLVGRAPELRHHTDGVHDYGAT